MIEYDFVQRTRFFGCVLGDIKELKCLIPKGEAIWTYLTGRLFCRKMAVFSDVNWFKTTFIVIKYV